MRLKALLQYSNTPTRGTLWLTLGAILFALCLPVQAQQPKKVPRIGYLSPGSPSTNLG